MVERMKKTLLFVEFKNWSSETRIQKETKSAPIHIIHITVNIVASKKLKKPKISNISRKQIDGSELAIETGMIDRQIIDNFVQNNISTDRIVKGKTGKKGAYCTTIKRRCWKQNQKNTVCFQMADSLPDYKFQEFQRFFRKFNFNAAKNEESYFLF